MKRNQFSVVAECNTYVHLRLRIYMSLELKEANKILGGRKRGTSNKKVASEAMTRSTIMVHILLLLANVLIRFFNFRFVYALNDHRFFFFLVISCSSQHKLVTPNPTINWTMAYAYFLFSFFMCTIFLNVVEFLPSLPLSPFN